MYHIALVLLLAGYWVDPSDPRAVALFRGSCFFLGGGVVLVVLAILLARGARWLSDNSMTMKDSGQGLRLVALCTGAAGAGTLIVGAFLGALAGGH